MRQAICLATLQLFLIGGSAPIVLGQGDARLPAVVKPKPKPKPTPTPTAAAAARREEPVAPPSSRAPAKTPPIAFNQLVTAALDPQTSGIINRGIYYDEYLLTAAEADLFTIILQTPDRRVNIQVYAKSGGLPILQDPRSGEFKLDTPGGTLPESGEFRVRVYGVIDDAASGPVGYTLRLNRTGLTEEGYRDRLSAITDTYRQSNNVDEAISKLEQLVHDDENQAGAYEMLGVLYLYQRNELNKAEVAMEKAIKLKGAAIFSVTYDPTLGRKPIKKPDGKYDWAESRTAWLRVEPDRLTLADAEKENEYVFSMNGAQIKEIAAGKPGNTPVHILLRPVVQQKAPFLFSPNTKSVNESELILKFIRQYVPPRG
jgi:tetratricopeptide (TPR) repeat protein